MDWGTLTVQVVVSGGTVAVAWLGLKGKLAEIGQDTKETKTAALKTETSINNRDTPASDRWDAMHEDILLLREDQREFQREVTLLRAEDRSLRKDTRAVRQELQEHVRLTEHMVPMLEDLHRKYSTDGEIPHGAL